MKKTVFILFILLTGLAFQSCTPNDSKLQQKVETEISAMYPEVMTRVNSGVATLSGTVKTESEKMAAEEAVKKVKNIKSVVNNINVARSQQPEVTFNSDATLNSTIMSGLNAAGYNDVRVDVRNGEVYLTGDVKRADLERVMQIANEASPRRVVNELNIK